MSKMDFGLMTLEALAGPEGGGGSSKASDPETKLKGLGSGLVEQEDSGAGEDDWKSSKMAKSGSLSSHKPMPLYHGSPLLRSNAFSTGDGRKEEHTLSFSSVKSEVPFLRKDGLIVDKNIHNSFFPYYQRPPSAYPTNAGCDSGSLNASMHGTFAGVRGPFSPSQWIELEHQALIYKYITLNVPVPSNLLSPIKRSLYPYGLSGSTPGSLPHNSYPEPGRCRRTDGKKWRCSRDAVADQKYCERHINRGRHRSRKPVEGQTGHAASGTTNLKVVPITSSVSKSVLPSGASNSLTIGQHQFKKLRPGDVVNRSVDAVVSRMQESGALSTMSSAISLKSNESTFTISKQEIPLEEFSESLFGLVSTDSLHNPSHRGSCLNSKSYGSFLDFNDQETQDQNPLLQFIDDWPKDQSNCSVISWPEELKLDWTQLSMSIPMATSDFSSSSSSPTQEKLPVSPPRLVRTQFEPTQMNLGISTELSEPSKNQTNRIPISWGTSMGGPLGEVLTSTTNIARASKNSSALILLTEGWDSSPQLGSSPTGVLQKVPFGSLSNSSSGSSLGAENKRIREGGSMFDDVLGSTLASSSIPSL
ncbi:growth-regulating factor 1-like isoform X2 [Juglans regia]|uniref:Growth-regulating factor n=1 Tax=Juglans regia TaxID=51240 RepID=A0A6P9DX91_JUGRE|nr:growth-regulating factor 1-like isoform X2 [Juglans regia]